MKRYMILLLVCIVVFTGCVDSTQSNQAVITPDTLFNNEDLKKLEPHLDLITGCVKLTYKGSKKDFKIFYEIWKDGEMVETHDTIAFAGIDDKHFEESLISVSIKKVNTGKHRMKLLVSGAMTSPELDIPDEYSYQAVNLSNKAYEDDSEDIVIWGMVGHKVDGEPITFYVNDISKTLQSGDIAVILKIRFD